MEFKSDEKKMWLEDENGKVVALLDYPEVAPGVVNFAHTEVDPSLIGCPSKIGGKFLLLAPQISIAAPYMTKKIQMVIVIRSCVSVKGSLREAD